MKRRLTTTYLLELTSFVIRGLKHIFKQIYTIFSKSFDSLNHDLLVRKLDLLGIPVDHLKWILSYLNCSLLSTSLPLSRYLWCPTRDPFGSATFYFVFKRPSLKL